MSCEFGGVVFLCIFIGGCGCGLGCLLILCFFVWSIMYICVWFVVVWFWLGGDMRGGWY